MTVLLQVLAKLRDLVAGNSPPLELIVKAKLVPLLVQVTSIVVDEGVTMSGECVFAGIVSIERRKSAAERLVLD